MAERPLQAITARVDFPVYSDADFPFRAGYVGDRIIIRPKYSNLLNLGSVRWGPKRLVARAVFVLAHELGHKTLGNDEDRANAWADANFVRVAKKLGASPARAEKLWAESTRISSWD